MGNRNVPAAQTIPGRWYSIYRESQRMKLLLHADRPLDPLWEQYPELFTREDRFERWTIKQIHARAHCLAGYFLSKNIEKQAVVAISAESKPLFWWASLGCHLIGLRVRPYLPEQLGTFLSEEQEEQPVAVLLSAYPEYNQHKDVLDDYWHRGGLVMVDTYHWEELDFEDNIITLETANLWGKEWWRTHREEMARAQAKVNSNDIAVLRLANDQPLSHKHILKRGLELDKLLNESSVPQSTLLLQTNARHQLCWDTAYALVLAGLRVLVFAGKKNLPGCLPTQRSYCSVVTVEQVGQRLQEAQQRFAGKSKKRKQRIEKGIELNQERLKALAQGRDLPFFKRRKWKKQQKRIFTPLRQKAFPRLEQLAVWELESLSPAQRALLKAMQLPLLGVSNSQWQLPNVVGRVLGATKPKSTPPSGKKHSAAKQRKPGSTIPDLNPKK